ncbi:MAG: enoyl-CoA hydratase/isomerase family protein [Thermodesulfobacteriota bacterium]|nr:enoyl-CoA hydratase/isomerase family protein [Thermodesulfobacteriota bacterium]
MRKISNLEVNYDFFYSEKAEDILILNFKEKPLARVIDLNGKKVLFDYLDFVSTFDEIKVVLMTGSPAKMGYDEFIEFYHQIIQLEWNQDQIERLYNAIDQFILKIVGFNKMVIHADSGNIILLFMNISLSFDYSVIADNTVFQNPNLQLGLVPKGGGIFFLSKILGSRKTSEILLSGKDIIAKEALRLGIVNKVVPVTDLKETALSIAKIFAKLPVQYSSGIKKLLNYDINNLKEYLEYENSILRRMIQSNNFKKSLVR